MRPAYSILYSAPVAATAVNGGPGDVLVWSSTANAYVLATTAARGSRRSTGVALSTYVAGGVVDLLQVGELDATTANLGAGTAGWVRVSATGSLERATPTTGDDVVGYVETDGTFHGLFGILTAAIVNGSGGGATLPIDLTSQVTGTLPVANGGTGVTASTGTGSVVLNNGPSFAAFDLKNAGATGPRYFFVGGAIVANRNINYPVLTADDVPVFQSFTQTLTNKTLVAASNTITDTSAATGDILRHNGTRFVRLARGTANQVLTTNGAGTDIAWATPSAGSGLGTNVTSGTEYIAIAIASGTVSTVGALRFPQASSTQYMTLGASNYSAISTDGSGLLTFGDANLQSQIRWYSNSLWYGDAFGVDGQVLGSYCMQWTPSAVNVAQPMVGDTRNSSPWGSVDGQAIIAVSTTNITLSASQYNTHIQKFTGSPAASRTMTYPLPADDAHSYTKVVWNQTSQALVVANGGGLTVNIVANDAPRLLIFTPTGVIKTIGT